MRKEVNLIVFLIFVFGTSYAQYHEFGVFVGGANYFGDMNVNSQVKPKFPTLGGIYRYNANPYVSNRISFIYGKISFDDLISVNELNQLRNLKFYTDVYEFSYQFEFNFFRYNKESSGSSFAPYMFLGIGVFSFNPRTEYQGEIYNLVDLGTEGQNSLEDEKQPYKLLQMAFPVGGGIKWSPTKNLSLNFEIGNRKTTTDYLDDVSGTYPDDVVMARYNDNNSQVAIELSDRSFENGEKIGREHKQRGYSRKKDNYLFFGLIVSYTINGTTCFSFRKRFDKYQ